MDPGCDKITGRMHRCYEHLCILTTHQPRLEVRHMAIRHDITRDIGSVYWQLTVIGPSKQLGTKWADLCRCSCGKEIYVRRSDLRTGNTKSCGCSSRARSVEASKTHGMYGTLTYQSWWAMKQRCTYPKHIEYHRYAKQGVKLCDRWMIFANFLEDMGVRPSKAHSIDRWPNGSGNYEPGNCRWATKVEQANNCSTNRIITAFGETGTCTLIARKYGMKPSMVYRRLKRGWSPEDALTKPPRSSVMSRQPLAA